MQACHIIMLPPQQIIRYNPFFFWRNTSHSGYIIISLLANKHSFFLFDRSSFFILHLLGNPAVIHDCCNRYECHFTFSTWFEFFSSSYSAWNLLENERPGHFLYSMIYTKKKFKEASEQPPCLKLMEDLKGRLCYKIPTPQRDSPATLTIVDSSSTMLMLKFSSTRLWILHLLEAEGLFHLMYYSSSPRAHFSSFSHAPHGMDHEVVVLLILPGTLCNALYVDTSKWSIPIWYVCSVSIIILVWLQSTHTHTNQIIKLI